MKRKNRPRPADGVFERKDRPGFWISWIDRDGRRRKRKTDAPTLAQARMVLSEEKRRVEQARVLGFAPPGDDLFADVAVRYLARQRATLTPASYVRTGGELRNHLLPAFGPRPVASLRKADVEGYVAARVAAGAGAATLHKELVTLKHLLKAAVEWEIIPVNPAAGVKGPKPPAGRVRYLHPGELRALLAASPQWLRAIVGIAVSTGMRRGEILGLRWLDVDAPHARVLLPQTKNGDSRIVYLNASALAVIAAQPPGAPAARVFPVRSPQYVRVAFERARRRAGIEDFHFHDCRHTAASWMRMRGADIHTVAQLLGHRDLRMAMRYQHLSPGFLGEAVAKLDDVFGETIQARGAPPPALLPPPASPAVVSAGRKHDSARPRSVPGICRAESERL